MLIKLLFVVAICITTAQAALPAWVAQARNDSLKETWMQKHEALLNQTQVHASEIKVVFLGDSITEFWKYNGKQVWQQFYAPRHAFNYGIGGDHTGHVLWRVGHEFDNVHPKLVVLMIGTNNLKWDNNADIAMGIYAILDELKKKMPQSRILLLSVLPREPENLDTKCHELNGLIARFADHTRGIHYLDLTPHFESGLGQERAEFFNPDHLHLSPKGYEQWHKAMEPTFVKLIV